MDHGDFTLYSCWEKSNHGEEFDDRNFRSLLRDQKGGEIREREVEGFVCFCLSLSVKEEGQPVKRERNL